MATRAGARRQAYPTGQRDDSVAGAEQPISRIEPVLYVNLPEQNFYDAGTFARM